MSTSVVLPALGESVTEGTVTRWLKNVGDTVAEDEGLLEISTDKVDTEIPSPVSGVLEQIHAQEDETVEVGALLATVGDGSGAGQARSDESDADDAEKPAPQDDAAEQESAESTDNAPAAAPEEHAEPAASEQPRTDAAGSGSANDVRLPELGESVTEGTVTRWLKSVGDQVETDEPLLEISTDKVDTEIPAPFSGTLQEILVNEDETVDVGAVLARIGSQAAPTPAEPTPAPSEPTPAPADAASPASDESRQQESAPAAPAAPTPPAEPAPAPSAPTPSAPAAPTQESKDASPAAGNDDVTYVTPLVRRLAQQQGVDLTRVTGTGVGGRIRKEDVLKAAERAAQPQTSSPSADRPAPEVSALRGTREPMTRLRKVLAERALASTQQTAQLTTVVEVDVTRLAGVRDRLRASAASERSRRLSFLPFFTKAVAEALRTYPVINATIDTDQIVYPDTENISVAVDTERGMLTPVLRDAGDKTVAQLADEIDDLARRTREGSLGPDELAGGTFTITNTGSRGALFDTPIVYLPQSAALATGAVVKRPGVVTVDGVDTIGVRSYVYLSLSYDHRIIDGADAARFLAAVSARLEAAQFDDDLGR